MTGKENRLCSLRQTGYPSIDKSLPRKTRDVAFVLPKTGNDEDKRSFPFHNCSVYEQSFAADIVSKCPYGFTIEDVERTRFHSRDQTESKEAFAHLKNLIPSWNNAFLFDIRIYE